MPREQSERMSRAERLAIDYLLQPIGDSSLACRLRSDARRLAAAMLDHELRGLDLVWSHPLPKTLYDALESVAVEDCCSVERIQSRPNAGPWVLLENPWGYLRLPKDVLAVMLSNARYLLELNEWQVVEPTREAKAKACGITPNDPQTILKKSTLSALERVKHRPSWTLSTCEGLAVLGYVEVDVQRVEPELLAEFGPWFTSANATRRLEPVPTAEGWVIVSDPWGFAKLRPHTRSAVLHCAKQLLESQGFEVQRDEAALTRMTLPPLYGVSVS